MLQGYGVDAFVAAEDALAAAQRLRAFIEKRFRPQRLYVEYPMQRCEVDGRVTSGWIDLVLETNAGWVVIDHKSSPRPKSELQAEALEHSGQLAEYAKGLEASGRAVASSWIHFPVVGALVQVNGL